jgi:3-isopropylmalate/(R)-2-methylmalate dehydratase large subunit
MARTLYDRIVDAHAIGIAGAGAGAGDTMLLYVDRTVLNEYTSPQAFTGLRAAGRRPWRPGAALSVVDHVNPTASARKAAMADADAQRQVDYLRRNCDEFGIEMFDILDPRQGIEHVVAPEQGLVLPGMVVAAGDSHTTTYGALGALGFGIGTSDIEHYLATQTVRYRRLLPMRITVDHALSPGVTPKDLILAMIGAFGADAAHGHALEFAGPAISAMSVEGRLTLCNMAAEMGARGAIVAPDQRVFDHVAGRPRSPRGALWDAAVAHWRSLRSDDGAVFARDLRFDARAVEPMVTWGTSPDQALPISATVPDPAAVPGAKAREAARRALDYMGLTPGTPLTAIAIDRAFIGSCTNARIEDLREAASVAARGRVADGVRAMVVPGSSAVRRQAEAERLDRIFLAAGFEWRQSGCSMCLAMNDDVLAPGERCASSTNRNFEGRQGRAGRTHLMSPAMVAAAAIAGHLVDVRQMATVAA